MLHWPSLLASTYFFFIFFRLLQLYYFADNTNNVFGAIPHCFHLMVLYQFPVHRRHVGIPSYCFPSAFKFSFAFHHFILRGSPWNPFSPGSYFLWRFPPKNLYVICLSIEFFFIYKIGVKPHSQVVLFKKLILLY